MSNLLVDHLIVVDYHQSFSHPQLTLAEHDDILHLELFLVQLQSTVGGKGWMFVIFCSRII